MNKEKLVGNVKVVGSCGCSDRDIMEFRILRRGNKANKQNHKPGQRRACWFSNRPVYGVAWKNPMR